MYHELNACVWKLALEIARLSLSSSSWSSWSWTVVINIVLVDCTANPQQIKFLNAKHVNQIKWFQCPDKKTTNRWLFSQRNYFKLLILSLASNENSNFSKLIVKCWCKIFDDWTMAFGWCEFNKIDSSYSNHGQNYQHPNIRIIWIVASSIKTSVLLTANVGTPLETLIFHMSTDLWPVRCTIFLLLLHLFNARIWNRMKLWLCAISKEKYWKVFECRP